jgi:putative hydrolase of the HAD superfamily
MTIVKPEFAKPEFMYFDLGNVLLYFDHSLAMRSMAKIANVDPQRMHAVIMQSDLQIEYETGLITGEQFIDRIAQSLDRTLDTNEMLQAAADMFVPNAQILPVLHHVKSLGIPIGLLSNTCEAHWNWILHMKYPQVVDWFVPVILSFEAKSMKPDSQIYRIAAEQAGREPSKIFFTDDRHDNVEGARREGWMAEPFTSADRLMDIVRHW